MKTAWSFLLLLGILSAQVRAGGLPQLDYYGSSPYDSRSPKYTLLGFDRHRRTFGVVLQSPIKDQDVNKIILHIWRKHRSPLKLDEKPWQIDFVKREDVFGKSKLEPGELLGVYWSKENKTETFSVKSTKNKWVVGPNRLKRKPE